MGANANNFRKSKIPGTVKGDGSHGTQLTGRTLVIARLVWITLSLLVAGLYIWTLSLENFNEDEIVFGILMPLLWCEYYR